MSNYLKTNALSILVVLILVYQQSLISVLAKDVVRANDILDVLDQARYEHQTSTIDFLVNDTSERSINIEVLSEQTNDLVVQLLSGLQLGSFSTQCVR